MVYMYLQYISSCVLLDYYYERMTFDTLDICMVCFHYVISCGLSDDCLGQVISDIPCTCMVCLQYEFSCACLGYIGVGVIRNSIKYVHDSSSSFRLLKYTKDRTPSVTAATGVLVTNK